MCHRGSGAAGTHEHDPAAIAVGGDLFTKAANEAARIGIVSDAPTIREHDRVDRADSPRIVRQVIEQVDDRFLAGMSDIQA